MPFSFFAVAYLSPHISINIVEFSGLGHSDEGTPTGDSNRKFRCNAARAKAMGRQQPGFLVNLVELVRCSINIFLKNGRNLWPE